VSYPLVVLVKFCVGLLVCGFTVEACVHFAVAVAFACR